MRKPRNKWVEIELENRGLVLAIGGNVLAAHPAIAARVGEVAAHWAHAEAELGSHLAVLLNTTPERTAELLKPYGSASATAKATRALAKHTHDKDELDDFLRLLSQFERLATERNRLQHGIWVRKSTEPNALFLAKSSDYSRFLVGAKHAPHPATFAQGFADGLTERYTEERVADLVTQLHVLTEDLFYATFRRLRVQEGQA